MNDSFAHPYFTVKTLDWIDKHHIYLDVVGNNPNPAALQFLISISDFSRPYQVYCEWNGLVLPWFKSIWESISSNSDAIDILEKYQKHIHWTNFCKNTSPRAVKILIKNPDKINWGVFSENSVSEAVDYMIQNPEKIVWSAFSRNTSEKALKFMAAEHPEKIDWYALVSNPTEEAMKMLDTCKYSIDWINCVGFLRNPAILPLLRTKIEELKNHDEYTRYILYQNPNPAVINFIINDIPDEYVMWDYVGLFHPKIYRLYKNSKSDIDYLISVLHCISMEPAVIDLIEENQDRTFWEDVCKNPAIFEHVYDYKKIREQRREINEEIVAKYWNPARVGAWIEEGVEIDDM
jgi:hypothetical protein